MKTRVLIIEDNFHKFFATKQVLETQLKLSVEAKDVESGQQLLDAAKSFAPDTIMFRPNGGISELLERMKKRRTNRRNTEIKIVLVQDFDDEAVRRFQLFFEQMLSGVAKAA